MQNTRLAIRFIISVLVVVWGGVLSGCDECEGINCAPCNAYTSDIVLAFDSDSLRGGFRKAEISGAYAVRYSAPGFTDPVDTLRQTTRYGTNFYRYLIALNMLPWPGRLTGASAKGFITYNYRFVVPAANRTYDLRSIELQTEPNGGCCGCGHNTRRRFVLNGVPIVADGSENDERPTIFQR
jgi:hypothetical protein